MPCLQWQNLLTPALNSPHPIQGFHQTPTPPSISMANSSKFPPAIAMATISSNKTTFIINITMAITTHSSHNHSQG
uniref:Myb family transcription factor family protein n=1 Tax=Rhizophora mucronata TaxID=61149 RepID=A0A2P2R0V8_RHIMU